jgi:hypothetical protein
MRSAAFALRFKQVARCSFLPPERATRTWGFVLPNVRHERWTKGREAAFGTSARWRG